MNPKIPTCNISRTCTPNVSRQECLITSASTPWAKLPPIIETLSHSLYVLTNLQQRSRRNPCTIWICFLRTRRFQQSTLSRTISKPHPHPKICKPARFAFVPKKNKDSNNKHLQGNSQLRPHRKKYARSGLRERHVSGASTPSAKASHSIGTQSHRLNGLTNPQQRARHQSDDQEIPLHGPHWFTQKPKHSNNRTFPRYSKPSPHPRTCTSWFRLRKISSPALARHEQDHHAALERNHTTSTA